MRVKITANNKLLNVLDRELESPFMRTPLRMDAEAAVNTPSAKREYYGFVVYLCSFVALSLYLLWSILPDFALESIGITYYPSRFGTYYSIFGYKWFIMVFKALGFGFPHLHSGTDTVD